MKEENAPKAKKTKKPYVKPAIEKIITMPENICLVTVSKQKPPQGRGTSTQSDEDDSSEDEPLKPLNVWSD